MTATVDVDEVVRRLREMSAHSYVTHCGKGGAAELPEILNSAATLLTALSARVKELEGLEELAEMRAVAEEYQLDPLGDFAGHMTERAEAAEAEAQKLRAERDEAWEQLGLRDQRDRDMQEIMRINNELLAEIAKLKGAPSNDR